MFGMIYHGYTQSIPVVRRPLEGRTSSRPISELLTRGSGLKPKQRKLPAERGEAGEERETHRRRLRAVVLVRLVVQSVRTPRLRSARRATLAAVRPVDNQGLDLRRPDTT